MIGPDFSEGKELFGHLHSLLSIQLFIAQSTDSLNKFTKATLHYEYYLNYLK